jgi:hypothetical protein
MRFGRRSCVLDPNDIRWRKARRLLTEAVSAQAKELKPLRSIFRCSPVHSFQFRISVWCRDRGRSNLNILPDGTDSPMSGEFEKVQVEEPEHEKQRQPKSRAV